MMAKVEFVPKHYTDAQGRYLGAFAGKAQPPAGAVEIESPPPPPYRERRMAAYAAQLGKDPGDVIKTLGDVVDTTIGQIEAIRVATSTAATPEWSAMLTKIAAIKTANPSS